MPRRRSRVARAQIRSAQLARTGDGPGGGSRRENFWRCSTTGRTPVDRLSTATRFGVDPSGTTRSTFAGTEGTTILSQDRRAPIVNVPEAGACASPGQQHDRRTTDPQRMNSSPWVAPDASRAGARSAAMSLLWRRARIPVGDAEPMPLLFKEAQWMECARIAQGLPGQTARLGASADRWSWASRRR